MSELSGVMDGAAGRYSVCDVADEEVHFSRDMFNADGSCRPQGMQQQHQQQRSLSITIDQINPGVLLHNNNVRFTDINLNQSQAAANQEHQSERVKSSRLLNSIGSRLRRGSNYLIAPKLIGQYLLGITIQSWTEFLNTSRMLKAPSNTQQLTRRLLGNLSYFQGNYLCVSLILIIYCILTSPLLLLAIIGYFLALYFITSRSATGRPIRILTFKPNLQQQYSFITIVSIPLLWVAGAPSAVFWVIGASFVVVGLHASMYNNDKLYQTFNELHPATTINNQDSYHLPNNNLQLAQNLYYNHYPTTANQYLSVATGNPGSPIALASQTAGRKSSSSWSHWVLPFGGGGGAGGPRRNSNQQQSAPLAAATSASGQPNSSSKRQQELRSTSAGEVMIISHDYAGLGRVYEV